MLLQTLLSCVLLASVSANEDVDYTKVAQQVIQRLQGFGDLFEKFTKISRKFSHEGTFYYVFADNVTLVGIEDAHLHGTPKGKNIGSNGNHEIMFLMNLGKVVISSDLQVVQQGHEGEKPDEYKLSGTSIRDLILKVTLNYNAKDKSVTPLTTYTEQSAQYTTHSDCHHEGNFCEKLHEYFDEFGWIPVFLPTHALVNKAITEIHHL